MLPPHPNQSMADNPTPQPPVPPQRPHTVHSPHGDRVDEYYWMRDDTRSGPEIIDGGAALRARRTDKVQLGGRFDPSRHLLLSREPEEGGVGVDVVTPFRLNDGTLVLVDRGWMAVDSAEAAHPEEDRCSS